TRTAAVSPAAVSGAVGGSSVRAFPPRGALTLAGRRLPSPPPSLSLPRQQGRDGRLASLVTVGEAPMRLPTLSSPPPPPPRRPPAAPSRAAARRRLFGAGAPWPPAPALRIERSAPHRIGLGATARDVLVIENRGKTTARVRLTDDLPEILVREGDWVKDA